jgi:hypothetical protein
MDFKVPFITTLGNLCSMQCARKELKLATYGRVV